MDFGLWMRMITHGALWIDVIVENMDYVAMVFHYALGKFFHIYVK